MKQKSLGKMKKDIWKITADDIKKDFKRGKDMNCLLDMTYSMFYFAGQFGNKIPVDEGREITELILLLAAKKIVCEE